MEGNQNGTVCTQSSVCSGTLPLQFILPESILNLSANHLPLNQVYFDNLRCCENHLLFNQTCSSYSKSLGVFRSGYNAVACGLEKTV